MKHPGLELNAIIIAQTVAESVNEIDLERQRMSKNLIY